jgi:hypothetical protein
MISWPLDFKTLIAPTYTKSRFYNIHKIQIRFYVKQEFHWAVEDQHEICLIVFSIKFTTKFN